MTVIPVTALWPGPSIDDRDIATVEAHLGFKLPQEYVDYLKQDNGGRPVPSDFPVSGNVGASAIDTMFGIDAANADNDLEMNRATFAGRVPNDLLPIAFDAGGSLVCMGTDGDRFGRIYFWDAEFESSAPTYANVSDVAPGFAEFLALLGTTRGSL